ncbi:Dyp-type peroxidase [Streptomyces formicae]|uniref:Ferrous iron transport peroxidase EfeB n=1 Tax=Streptomyces formicae TaxID=1616117 RepID=A0A291Q142_9ACTN|nr:Dyp-type peroxidase [Streptomyces formicae]ATL25226.1 Ferrous iron transport peroxidase EfeB [Streptomyces formicae]
MTVSPPPRRRTLLLAPLAAASACGAPSSPSSHPAGARPQARTQHGIATAQPARVLLTAYDLASPGATAAAVRATLSAWWSRPAPDITLTVAAGPGLYRKLAVPAPDRLKALPAFPGDRLDPRRGGGDVLVQLCGDDAAACARAATRLTARAAGVLTQRWRQEGFLPPRAAGQTPLNLFGFKDGTENPGADELHRWVWNGDGTTYLVYRRIHMAVDTFTALPVAQQERVIGRHRASGAPLGGEREHDPVDLYAKTPQGRYLIPAQSHVRLAHSRLDGGARMLRRGYSYDDGADDRGLLFLSYMRDPALFVRVQQRLAAADAMNRFLEHRASAVGHVLAAPAPGSAFGDQLR